MESQETQTPTPKIESILKNKDNILFETPNLELANKIRVSIMSQYSTLRPWVFVNKLWSGITQNDYYVISIMNEHNHSFDQTTIDMLQLHIFNLNMEYNLKDEQEKQLDVVWV
jgi:hypothetical protein